MRTVATYILLLGLPGCLANSGCCPFGSMRFREGSTAEYQVAEYRSALETIEQVEADRARSNNFAVIQHSVREQLINLHDIESCQLVIHPKVIQEQNEGNIIRKKERIQILALVTTKTKGAWKAQDVRDTLLNLLKEDGLPNASIHIPIQSGDTWVVTGWVD